MFEKGFKMSSTSCGCTFHRLQGRNKKSIMEFDIKIEKSKAGDHLKILKIVLKQVSHTGFSLWIMKGKT